jgi:hypothetical protein
MRQQPRCVEHGSCRLREVVGRRRSPKLRQCIARDRITQLRLVAQREQRLLAVGRGAGASDLEHVVDRQVGLRQVTRPMRERAVVTDVAAELRQRNEDLARIADRAPEALDREFFGNGLQRVERRGLETAQRGVVAEAFAARSHAQNEVEARAHGCRRSAFDQDQRERIDCGRGRSAGVNRSSGMSMSNSKPSRQISEGA